MFGDSDVLKCLKHLRQTAKVLQLCPERTDEKIFILKVLCIDCANQQELVFNFIDSYLFSISEQRKFNAFRVQLCNYRAVVAVHATVFRGML